ncbi:YitT family protein [Alkalihalobacillus macyae]|uniref:YitT family protein n=1 Tax=Guptibacillus hwajinpoensis TaxID=208199 RepID=UPI00273BA268|nr:YitT family protein [Alkalihalobacillus macyae]MDP4551881.1 YitT family protein [Alkalihalobacillus macyae]
MYKKMAAVFFGSILVGFGINGFLVPNQLIDGGMIGIGLIIKYIWGYQTGLTIIFLSIPLYIIAFVYFRPYFYNSLHGLLLSSFFIDVLSPLRHTFSLSILPSAILGGLFVGSGIGLMLKFDTSTGGTDLLAQFISRVLSLNVGMIIFLIDGFVIIIGSKTIGLNATLYSAVTIFAVGIATGLLTLHKQTA